MPEVQPINSSHVTALLNGTIASIKAIVPVDHTIGSPELSKEPLKMEYGVLIGMTGDVKGKIVLSGKTSLFGAIGERMFGMPLEGTMLHSFSGELGNMVAGGLSTRIEAESIRTDITAPTIMEGKTTLSGYQRSIVLPVQFDSIGELVLFLLLD